MPIDVSPPMSGNLQGFQIAQPQSTDPLQTLAQMGQLRTQGLQQQQAQLGITQAQQQLASQKAMMQAFATGGGDWDKTQKLMYSNPNILPSDLMAMEQHRLQVQTQAATLTKDKQAILGSDMDRYRGFLDGVTDQDSLDQANLNASKVGVSQEVPRLTTFPGDADHVKAFANSLALHSQAVEEGLKGAQTAASVATAGESTARAGQATAETAKTQLETGITQAQLDYIKQLTSTPKGLADYVSASIDKTKYPDLWNRAYNEAQGSVQMRDLKGVRDAVAKNAAMASEQEKTVATETDPRVLKAREDVARANTQGRVTIEMARDASMLQGGGANAPGGAGSDGLSGDAYLGTLNPAFAARLKAIARGDEAAPTGRAATSGPGALLMNALYRYDPDFTPLLAQKRKTELADFTKTGSGDAGGKIVALDTMIHHADLYLETADALKNGTFVPGNRVYNAVATAFGKAPPTEAGLVAQFFAGETAKVAGEQSQGEVNAILDKMKTDGSPEQMKQAGQRLLQIAAGRMIPYQERIADAKLQNLAPPILGPSEKEILQRRGFDPNTMQPVKQGGPAQYSKYGKDPKTGHRIGLGTDNKWHDVVSGAVIQ